MDVRTRQPMIRTSKTKQFIFCFFLSWSATIEESGPWWGEGDSETNQQKMRGHKRRLSATALSLDRRLGLGTSAVRARTCTGRTNASFGTSVGITGVRMKVDWCKTGTSFSVVDRRSKEELVTITDWDGVQSTHQAIEGQAQPVSLLHEQPERFPEEHGYWKIELKGNRWH